MKKKDEQDPIIDDEMLDDDELTPSAEQAEKKEEKPQQSTAEAMKNQAREDESSQSVNFSLYKILGGDWLTTDFLRRQILLILLIAAICMVYINNRYRCQKDMLEIDQLNTDLVDAKYKALSSSSELTEMCRESNVLKELQNNKDSVLRIPKQPPYIIPVPQEHKPEK